jgi:arginase
MPAVDYRQPGGLTFEELKQTLDVAMSSGRAMGIEIVIYNPRLDPDGSAGEKPVQVLAEALGTSAATS